MAKKKPKWEGDCPYCSETRVQYDDAGAWSCSDCGRTWADSFHENETAEEQEEPEEGGEE